MTFKLMKRGVVHRLYLDIEKNLDRYVSGNFEDLLDGTDFVRDIDETEVDENDFASLNPERGGAHDAENAFIVFKAMKGMTPYLARDERIWAYLTHTCCLDFTRKRWLRAEQDEEKLSRLIRSHFFARIGGDRAFERNNALSSLWWWAYISSHYEKAPLHETLDAFLKYTDLRSSIVERPTTSRSKKVFSALMDSVFKRLYEEPKPEFFVRRGNTGIYREWLKSINRYGGIRLFDAREANDLSELFENLAVAAEQNASAP